MSAKKKTAGKKAGEKAASPTQTRERRLASKAFNDRRLKEYVTHLQVIKSRYCGNDDESNLDDKWFLLYSMANAVHNSFFTIPDLVYIWNVHTNAKAGNYESPESKVFRFFCESYDLYRQVSTGEWAHRLRQEHGFNSLLDVLRGWAPKLLPLLENPGESFFHLLLFGDLERWENDPSLTLTPLVHKWPVSFKKSLFPGCTEPLLPRSWETDIFPVWLKWLAADTSRKRRRPTAGQGHGAEGRFLPARADNGTFTSANAKKFRKKSL